MSMPNTGSCASAQQQERADGAELNDIKKKTRCLCVIGW